MWLSRLVNCSPFSFLLSLRSESTRPTRHPGPVPGRASSLGFPLGRAPFLHRLDGRYPRLRRLLRYHAPVRLLEGLQLRGTCPYGLRLVVFPRLPAAHHGRTGTLEVSRLPCRRHVLTCRGLDPGSDAAASLGLSAAAPTQTPCDAAPWSSPHCERVDPSDSLRFRGFIARPASSPVYASPPAGAQDSASRASSSSRGRTCLLFRILLSTFSPAFSCRL